MWLFDRKKTTRNPLVECLGDTRESPGRALFLLSSGADRIRTCGTGFPVHRFSKPALSTTQPPLPFRLFNHFLGTSRCDDCGKSAPLTQPSLRDPFPDRQILCFLASLPLSATELVPLQLPDRDFPIGSRELALVGQRTIPPVRTLFLTVSSSRRFEGEKRGARSERRGQWGGGQWVVG